MSRVRIDGRPYDLPGTVSVLDALRTAGIELPALCHDDRLAPSGSCRLCLVQVAGIAKPVPACTTPLADGMDIVTAAPELHDMRRSFLTMLAERYPGDAVAHDPDKPFHHALRQAGVVPPHATAPIDRLDGSHPYISVDLSRCIDCYRCVRICAELQGQFVWHIRDRGTGTTLHPDGPTLADSSCVSCGACVDTCPTGALEDRTLVAAPPVSNWTRTVCPYCGVGCEMNVGTTEGRIATVRPALDSAVSKGHLCVKGRYAFDFAFAPDRVTQPMIREGSAWRTVSWDDARAFLVDRLRALVARYGADSIGILGSARATNEENYLAQKLARTVIGTNNIDCCARVCHAPSSAALSRALGAGLSTNSFDDIERARTILVCGANVTESHPVVGARIRQAAMRGASLIVIDPRRTELAAGADLHLAIKPGTNVPLLNAMAHVILAEGLENAAFLAERVSSVGEFTAWAAAWTPERAAAICGIDSELIRRAARLYAQGAPAMSVHGLGLTEQLQGTDAVTTLINLALLTGNIGIAGAGVNALRGQNNVQGAAHMGCEPKMLPGSMPLAEGSASAEAVWGAPPPTGRGLNALEMMDAATAGRLKALWTIGYDVLQTNPNMAATEAALRSLDLVIVQDMFLTETAREFGTIFLPACSSFEKDGTFMNAERRIQRVRAALRPLGASKPDWTILCEMGQALGGRGFNFDSPQGIWDEVRALCAGARGMTYERLERGGLQWPCPAADHGGTSILHQDRFVSGRRAPLQPIEYQPTSERTDTRYPFTLTTGRSLYQFNAGTMTARTPNRELRPSDLLSVAPDDAARLSLHDGDVIRITSRHGSARLPVLVDPAMQTGQVFATFHDPVTRLNAVTGTNRDAITGTPEYKVTAVQVSAIETGPRGE